ncbi:PREDICTED: ubiquitin-like protein 4A [Ceratosolen solmsi marchali]|uniref:Ubiquitin-like protein 4A n=1 Tax=Ceratosolen solmsi marchali TaxID=326594 RepID=A0AAJ6VNE0_9HYME|nr:PREDICTED: ubiquitin-like protein 4A [Ceratosolen solmsi marchali]
MNIRVKILLGEEHIFEILPSDTVLQVKQKIFDRLGIEVAHQVLLYLGKALTDENEIIFYPGIKDGSKLVLVRKNLQTSRSKNGVYKFKQEMLKVLKTYYSEADALTIANETTKDLQNKVNHLSYDDLERLATALIHDQENKF